MDTEVTVPVNEKTDTVVVQLNGKMSKIMEDTQAVLEIKTGTADYKLPMQQINMDSVIEKFGDDIDPSDINVSIEVSRLSEEEVRFVEDTASKGNYEIVVPLVDFTVKCSCKNREVEISQFSSYIERAIVIPDGVDPQKITTAVIVEKTVQ